MYVSVLNGTRSLSGLNGTWSLSGLTIGLVVGFDEAGLLAGLCDVKFDGAGLLAGVCDVFAAAG
jgi:hypothetical protein